jgi:hypothetical protein
VLPVLVRGVIWDRAARHPLTYFKKTSYEKEKLAAALQLLAHVVLGLRPVCVSVQIGRGLTAEGLGTSKTSVLHTAVLDEMQRLIEHPPEGEGRPVL